MGDSFYKTKDRTNSIKSTEGNKKAQLSLTNPRDAKACQKLLQFDVLQRCRWQYWSIFIRLACCCFVRNLRNPKSLKIQTYTLWGIKNCTLLTGTITLQNYAILWWFLAHRCIREYPITCLFESLCKIENWVYQLIRFRYCLLISSQQRKMWNSCCNVRPQTSLLQTYGLLTVLALILWITWYVEYCGSVFIGNLLKNERWWTEAASDWSVAWHRAKCRWSGD